jgi:hypothetical protein
MREVKILQDQLRDEQQKVIELFEDAQTVRDEIMKEMSEFEMTKGKLEKMRTVNRTLRKKLNENSIDFSEMNQTMSDEENTPVDETLGVVDVD